MNKVRKNLLDFTGVDPAVADAETEKIADRLGRRKLDVVKDIASILAVPLSGPKEDCVAAVAAFLRNPHQPSVVPRKRQSVGSVEQKEKKAAKAQRKKAKSAKAAKSKGALPAAVKTATPFELYAKSALVKAKAANPSLSSSELDEVVAAEWQAQPDVIKAAFESAAASLKDAAKAAAAKSAPAAQAKANVKGGVAKDKVKSKAKKAVVDESDDDEDEDDDSSSSSSSDSEDDEDFGSKKKPAKKAAVSKSKPAASKAKPAPKPKEDAKSAAVGEDALTQSKFYSAVEAIITSASDEDMESLTKRKIRELLVAKGFAEDEVNAAKDDIAALCTQFVDKRS
jgi:hypothetical protein